MRIYAAKYRLDRLIRVELYPTPREAMARERQIKGWRRAKKIALIESERSSREGRGVEDPPGQHGSQGTTA